MGEAVSVYAFTRKRLTAGVSLYTMLQIFSVVLFV